ncbi:MAG TPA: hypothetical protein VFW49_00560 [Fluviicoccus sp.]|nr:hypothetical protein [Fluviicoccus sp.]
MIKIPKRSHWQEQAQVGLTIQKPQSAIKPRHAVVLRIHQYPGATDDLGGAARPVQAGNPAVKRLLAVASSQGIQSNQSGGLRSHPSMISRRH